MRCTLRWVFAGSCVISLVSVAAATVIHVPLEYPTIQAGINAAVDGDTVLVAPGTYTGPGNRDLDFYGRAIVVTSESGPEATIIDCEGSQQNPHLGFRFHSGEEVTSVVKGFTITNGWGGGIYCWESGPTIADNRIADNTADLYGGGIRCWSHSSPTIVGNTITGNTAERGGGIHCWDHSSPVMTGNMITWNTAHEDGAGIYCEVSFPYIVENTIAENVSDGGGGGISCISSSSPTILRNVITGNSASSRGGAIACRDYSSPSIVGNAIDRNTAYYGGGISCWSHSSPTVEGNVVEENTAQNGGGLHCEGFCDLILRGNAIIGNTASRHGGGIYNIYRCNPLIVDNTISGNTAGECGGGIMCYESSAIIERNTVAANAAGTDGGGIYCIHQASPTIVGNRVTGNTASDGGGGIFCLYSSAPTLTANTISANTAAYGGGIVSRNWSLPTLHNCVLWDDSGSTGPEIYVGDGAGDSWLEIEYSDVEGGSLAVYVAPGCLLFWNEGNIDADPLFVLPEQRDYRLLWGSPCIDAGHPDSLDPDGTRSDMGAYFFDQDDYLTLYLSPETTQVSPGGDLEVHYTVINRREEPEEFWIAAGVMTPAADTLLIMGPARYVIPAEYTAQVPVLHHVPHVAPLGGYHYASAIGRPPFTLYDWDDFPFTVGEP